MNTANFRRRFIGVLPAPSNLAWGLGGIAICAVVTVSAQQYQAAQQEAKPCAISDAIQQAINSKIALIGVTGTDPAKYFAVGSATSCLDGLLNTSFDLSKLIPDPLGWISDAAQFAIKKATEAAVGKVCQAARSAMGDVIGGQITMLFMVQGTARPHVQGGRVRALAHTGAKRSRAMPEVMTFTEAGFPSVEAATINGLVGPAGLPKDYVQRVNTRVARSMNTREMQEKMTDFGAEIHTNTPEEFAAWFRSEMVKWAKAVKDSGARVDNN